MAWLPNPLNGSFVYEIFISFLGECLPCGGGGFDIEQPVFPAAGHLVVIVGVRSENGWLELITMLIIEFDNIERRTKLCPVCFQVECWAFDLKLFTLHTFCWYTHAYVLA